jgi:SAM-dependent methyltransferase
MVDEQRPSMRPDTLPELVGLAIACGAADTGGPMTRSEIALTRRAVAASRASARRVRAAIRAGEDPLGDAFCAMRPALERRALGAFYTGPSLLEPMLTWSFAQLPQRIVDPGCGSGRFAVGAAMRSRNIRIVAVDLDPLATLLTRAALAAVGARNAIVLQGDYLTASIERIDGLTAFVGNPPYVRHHDLTPETKSRATQLAAKVGHDVSGLAGLHALFYLATLAKHGRAGDVGSFVTSAEWLDVGYGSVIRNMFTNGLGGRSLTVYDPETVPFEDAMTTAAITTFRIGEEPQLARIARIVDGTTRLTLEHAGRDVERATLAGAKRWSPFLREPAATIAGDTVGTRFRVSRGQVTGSNAFFVMSRQQARARGIERFCVPVVSSADEVFKAGGVLRDNPALLVGLEVPKDVNPKRFPRLASYIAEGEAAGVQLGYVTSHRSPWWRITFPKPPIVATYMARQAPLFAANPDRLGLLNIAHGLHPRAPMDDATVARVVETLNAQRATFVGRGRTYHGGLEKFEPGEMEALPLEVLT